MKAVSLSLTTIIVIIVLLLTIVAVLIFFGSGFTSAGEDVGGLFTDFRGKTDINPTHWVCSGVWQPVDILGKVVTVSGTDAGIYNSHEDCIGDSTASTCLANGNCACMCIDCTKDSECRTGETCRTDGE